MMESNFKRIKNNFSKLKIVDKIAIILGFLIFAVHMGQQFTFYAIDHKLIFSVGMTYFMLFLRWFTMISVGFAFLIPLNRDCKTCKVIGTVIMTIIGLLNLFLFDANMTAWGSEAYTPWRAILFIVQNALLVTLGGFLIYSLIINNDFKETKPLRIPWIIIGMMLGFLYQPFLHVVLGKADDVEGFNKMHILYILMNFVIIIIPYAILRSKPYADRRFFCMAMAVGGFINYFYYGYYGFNAIPFHLCNFALIVLLVAFVFDAKNIFYFTYFVNVIGAIFAMIFPDSVEDGYSLLVIRFWINHWYVFCLPILAVALKVFPRPNIKYMGTAIVSFTIYFLIVIVANNIFSNYGNVNYFFINTNFYFEKLSIAPTLKDNFVWAFQIGDLYFELFYLFYLVVYVVYIGLMFAIWYVYDAFFHIADAHYALHIKKKLIKQGYVDLRKALGKKKPGEPLYEEIKDMIEIKNFTKIYSGSKKPSVNNLSLTINDGEVYGFLGHNGAGKSTTIKAMVGIHSITSGQIIINGYDVEKQPVEAKLRIGYVSDNHAVYEKLTGREYINYIADLYLVSKEDRDARIEKYTKMFNLVDAIDREIKSYSHGMKQKIVVIASLIHDPKVWILDEPLTGLDPVSSYQIKECMREHAARGNIVFFSSHVIEVVEKICTKICIISHGELQCEYSLKELKEKGISLEELYLKYVSTEDVSSKQLKEDRHKATNEE